MLKQAGKCPTAAAGMRERKSRRAEPTEEQKEAAKCRGWNLASRSRLMVLPLRKLTASAQHVGFSTHGWVLKSPVRMALVQGQGLGEEKRTGALRSTASFL